jgi:hypothetical protein
MKGQMSTAESSCGSWSLVACRKSCLFVAAKGREEQTKDRLLFVAE